MRDRLHAEPPQISRSYIEFARMTVHHCIEPCQSRLDPIGRAKIVAGSGKRGALVVTLLVPATEGRVVKKVDRGQRVGQFAGDLYTGRSDGKNMHPPTSLAELLRQVI